MQENSRGKRALVFANGDQIDLGRIRSLIQPGDYLIAADGGLRHLNHLSLLPDLLVGDLDSITEEEVQEQKRRSVRIEQYPIHKNETDLELALLAAVKGGARSILIVGALGGRFDMALANLFLLGLPELAGLDVRLEDGIEEIFLINPGEAGCEITGQPGDRVSLLPLGGAAEGIHTEGLYYPLRGETLRPERTRGISNQMVGARARVTFEKGLLICIHTRLDGKAD